MENKMQVFSSQQFGNVRVVERDGEPWFVGKDVANILGYANPSEAIQDHVDAEDKLNSKTLLSCNLDLGQRGGWLINESGLYSLVLSSKLPDAKAFKRWVTSEILPSIRRTGGYVANEDMFLNTYLPHADEPTRAMFHAQLQVIRSMDATIARQQAQLAEQQPKVEFADHVADSKTLLTVSAFAKIVQNEDIKLGRNKLMAWLRDRGYLRANNEPYQQYIKQGLFRVREVYVNGIFYPVTFITGKGQLYLVENLKAEFCAA